MEEKAAEKMAEYLDAVIEAERGAIAEHVNRLRRMVEHEAESSTLGQNVASCAVDIAKAQARLDAAIHGKNRFVFLREFGRLQEPALPAPNKHAALLDAGATHKIALTDQGHEARGYWVGQTFLGADIDSAYAALKSREERDAKIESLKGRKTWAPRKDALIAAGAVKERRRGYALEAWFLDNVCLGESIDDAYDALVR